MAETCVTIAVGKLRPEDGTSQASLGVLGNCFPECITGCLRICSTLKQSLSQRCECLLPLWGCSLEEWIGDWLIGALAVTHTFNEAGFKLICFCAVLLCIPRTPGLQGFDSGQVLRSMGKALKNCVLTHMYMHSPGHDFEEIPNSTLESRNKIVIKSINSLFLSCCGYHKPYSCVDTQNSPGCKLRGPQPGMQSEGLSSERHVSVLLFCFCQVGRMSSLSDLRLLNVL